ncbi:MAG TPA: DUF5060 domain-containing protein [Bryobacteraceae bacterium]|nr:DUF5060 domain-containing protein [Bryobacteraceae bacterium]
MLWRIALALILICLPVAAQFTCPPTPVWSTCDIALDLNDAEVAQHPNPYLTVDLHIEFRSPTHKTYLMPGFWDGGRRMIVRFAPTEAGEWDFRITGNLPRVQDQVGHFTATPSEAPGFIHAANVHHWATADNKPHLWMGDTVLRFPALDRAVFESIVNARAKQKFNHLRGIAIGRGPDEKQAFPAPDRPSVDFFRQLDDRMRFIDSKGIAVDLLFASSAADFSTLFPTPQLRQRYIRYIVARYAPANITWQGVDSWESDKDGRALVKELGLSIKKLDPYQHPRSSSAEVTSSPFLNDGWEDYVCYRTSEDAVGSVEHQLYTVPFVNAEFAAEDSGAGKFSSRDVDSDTFRHRLWNSTMDGEYPTSANTGVDGEKPVEGAKFADSPGARAMTAWFNFFADTRHWELEPYFYVDGGRAVALDGAEYVVYVEKSGPIELTVEKHGYEVTWLNPVNGETTEGKKFNAEHFTGEPPDKSHDWVLWVHRNAHLGGYKFESRPVPVQEIEQDGRKIPFEVVEPKDTELSVGKPSYYAVKLTRESRATRSMTYLWTGEVIADGQGFRVVGTGPEGTFRVPPQLVINFPALLNLRVSALNANGKAYQLDKVYKLAP